MLYGGYSCYTGVADVLIFNVSQQYSSRATYLHFVYKAVTEKVFSTIDIPCVITMYTNLLLTLAKKSILKVTFMNFYFKYN